MTGRAAFVLGVAYGVSLGMAARGLLDYGEAVAHMKKRPPVQPAPVTLNGRDIEAAINRHRRETGRKRLS